MSDLQRMTVDDLRTWYEKWYAPNNATLVVVGDVTADEVRTLAERHFGPVARRKIPTAKAPLELDEPGERRLTLHLRTQLPSLLMAFNVPSLSTAENPRQVHALRLIAALLDGGYSARLAETLERGEELVTSASAWYDAYTRGDSLFVLSATPNLQKGHDLEAAEAGLWRQLERLQQTPPSPDELERVRAGHRRPGLRARFDHPTGHHHRPAGNRWPVLAADGRRARRTRGGDAAGHPAGGAPLFHPLANERCPRIAGTRPRAEGKPR